MNSLLSDSYLASYSSVDIHLQSSELSLHRFSQIKRKPAPTVSFRYPGDPLMELGSSLAVGHESSPNILMRPPTPSDDTHDFWNSLNNADSDIEEKSPPTKVGRPRAHTVPSKRFTKLVRIPPPIVDLDLLTGARTASVLQTASLPEQTVVQSPDPRANAVSYTADVVLPTSVHSGPQDTAAEEVIPLALPSDLPQRQKSKSFRQSAFGFMQKRKGSVGRKLSVASISAPVQQGPSSRKYSTASMITLSSFPGPPEGIPAMPSLDSWSPPKPDLHSLRSHILHVDPPLRPANAADIPGPTAATDAAQSQPPDNAVVDAANPVSQDAPSQLDNPRQFFSRTTGATGVTGKSPLPRAPIVLQNRAGPREPHFDFGEPPDFDAFDESRLPTHQQLLEAAELPVISESGVRVPFGNLWQGQKTIVCFIRHFWCPLCQDYMFSISRNVSPDVLRSAGMDLVVISNGSFEMIKSYRRIFRTPFALYTDPSHKVYNTLGMTLQTLEKGPRGNYVRHGLVGGIGMVVANAVKVGMPVWKQGGEISQLGGEFVLGPGMTCSWAHRMKYTRNHIPILQVLGMAGVDMYTPLNRVLSSTGGSFLGISSEEESRWMERRRRILTKLRSKKMGRRGGTQWMDATTSTAVTNSQRSSVGSEAAGSLCSWNVPTEEAINIGAMGYEDAIIEEEDEEEMGTAIKPQEPQIGESESELTPSEILSDTKSEYTESFISQYNESSATDVDSTVDGHSTTEGSFSPVELHFKTEVDQRTMSDRSGSFSSFGSGYDTAANYHRVFFANASGDKAAIIPTAAMSKSSLRNF